MNIKSISNELAPKSVLDNAEKGLEGLKKLSDYLPTLQEKFTKWGISLQGIFDAQFKIIGLADKTLQYVKDELENNTSNLSRTFTTAQKGLSIYDTVDTKFLGENNDSYDKASGGFSIASDLSDIGASWMMDDEQYKEYLAERQKYIEDANKSTLASTSDTFAKIANLSGKFLGEQNGFYKSMFAISKAFSIAKSIMSIKTAIAEGAASGPFPANLAAMATVAASTASIISDIQSINYTGQAHAGIDYIPREGTWLLDKGERVVDARTNADLKNFLQSSNQSSSGFSVNVPVTISGGDVSEEDGKQLGMMIKQSVMGIIQEQQRPGGILNRY